MYADDYHTGLGFALETNYYDLDFDCDTNDDEWDEWICEANNVAEYQEYGCLTDLWVDYYGNSNGCPDDYVCQSTGGRVDTGCCYYDGTADTTDD